MLVCVCVCGGAWGGMGGSIQVVDGSGLLQEVVCVLSSLELRLSEGSCRESDTNRVHIRIKELQKSLDTCVQYGPWSPAVNQTHSLTHTVKR